MAIPMRQETAMQRTVSPGTVKVILLPLFPPGDTARPARKV